MKTGELTVIKGGGGRRFSLALVLANPTLKLPISCVSRNPSVSAVPFLFS